MDKGFNTPGEVIEANISAGAAKAQMSIFKMIILGVMAGAFIAVGGAASNVAVHSISDVGLARTLAGVIFPVGLMMVVLTGGELFTGNCLMITALLDKKAKISGVVKNLVIVYFSNLIGAVIVALLCYASGQFNYTSGGLGAYTIKVAAGKAGIAPAAAVASGIMCNMLVCLAIIMALAAKDIAGKLMSVFFPIAAFVICGFEHCVANMYYIPAGMLAVLNKDYVLNAQSYYGVTKEQIDAITSPLALRSFVFVTIGNIIGGALFVGLMLYAAHKKKSHSV